ncbi:interleukin-21 receptor [Pholidichthys leucotaenia]
MDWCLPLKMMLLIVFLLQSTNIIWLHGNPITGEVHNLQCVNDYLVTMTCTLNIAPSENTSDSNSPYWLLFEDTMEQERCLLKHTEQNYFCTFKKSGEESDYFLDTFTDLDRYTISLCHKQNDGSPACELLEDDYRPVENIKPNTPCNLTVNHSSSQYHFTWKSSYEEFKDKVYTKLEDILKYQLHYYDKRGKEKSINTHSTNCTVDEDEFLPDTEYVARVRSSPDQAWYKGQLSDWSADVHWRTEPVVNDFPTTTLLYEVFIKVLIPLSGVVITAFLLCYVPLKKWRQKVFIPTPAPYFYTLYNDCQGDFKSWVVTQEIPADMLKKEETFQIDSLLELSEYGDAEEDCSPQLCQQPTEGSTYSNISASACDSALPGLPYAVSTMVHVSAHECPQKDLIAGSVPGSPAGDSGCWLSSGTSLEKEPPWYCNDYCTLNAFQQAGSLSAGPLTG